MKIRVFGALAAYLIAFSATGYASPGTVSSEDMISYLEKGPKFDPSPYIIPASHPVKNALDKIFAKKKVLKKEKKFESAGFKTRVFRKWSGMRVASHPKIKGYLFKAFLTKELDGRREKRQQNLIRRCVVAAKVRHLIVKHKMMHFTVPEKWLYQIPTKKRRTFILVVKDMNLVKRKKSEKAWKNQITRAHLDELHILLGHGYGSLAVDQNIPYTQNKTFSFIDTEYLERDFKLKRLNSSLSRKMRYYWKYLTYE